MSSNPTQSLPVSKLYEEFGSKGKRKKAKKLKSTCCEKYMKKKGKYCKSCPTLYAMCQNAGRDF